MLSMPPPVQKMLTTALQKAKDDEAEKRLLIASLEGQTAVAKKNLKELQSSIQYIEELNATQPVFQ